MQEKGVEATDFFGGLLDRATAQAAIVQRRQRSLFEPIPSLADKLQTQAGPAGVEGQDRLVESAAERATGRTQDFAPVRPMPPQSSGNQDTQDYEPPSASSFPLADYPSSLGKSMDAGLSGSRENGQVSQTHQIETIREIRVGNRGASNQANTENDRSDDFRNRSAEDALLRSLQSRQIETIREIRETKPAPKGSSQLGETHAIQLPSRAQQDMTTSALPSKPSVIDLKNVFQVETPSRKPAQDEDEGRDEGLLFRPKPSAEPPPSAQPSGLEVFPRRAVEFPYGKREVAEPQTIHVSIGRIEVRATAHPTADSSRGKRPAASRMSLEDYLRQREGVGR